MPKEDYLKDVTPEQLARLLSVSLEPSTLEELLKKGILSGEKVVEMFSSYAIFGEEINYETAKQIINRAVLTKEELAEIAKDMKKGADISEKIDRKTAENYILIENYIRSKIE